jgi:hypothetical protein
MPSAGFEPAIPANKWPQNYALDRAVTRIGNEYQYGNDIPVPARSTFQLSPSSDRRSSRQSGVTG